MAMLGLPPVPPPLEAPTLTSTMSPSGGGAGPRNAGGIPSLFFQAEGMLKQIALILPASSEQINNMVDELRQIMVDGLSGGNASPTGMPGLGGISSPTEEMKSGY